MGDWIVLSHTNTDKAFKIKGPHGFSLTVDYDDVDHEIVDFLAYRVAEVLNRHWLRYNIQRRINAILAARPREE